MQVNLSAYHGYNLKFLFEFDSLDDIANDGLGVCVDNLTVMTGCTGSDYECFQSEECPLEGPPDECYWYYCVNNQCDDEYIGGLNCCDVAVFAEESWEAGGSGWQYVPDNGTVRWQVADIAEAHEGSHFLYFGNTAAMNYNDGGATSGGEALSPQFVLPTVDADTDAITLRFAYYLDVEAYDVGAPGRDAFTVTAINPQSGQQTELMNKSNIPASHIGSDPLAWHVWEADMTDFSGEVIQVQFLFDSGDGNNNDGLGLLIDSFEIETEICE